MNTRATVMPIHAELVRQGNFDAARCVMLGLRGGFLIAEGENAKSIQDAGLALNLSETGKSYWCLIWGKLLAEYSGKGGNYANV